jgi:hypothetical protein
MNIELIKKLYGVAIGEIPMDKFILDERWSHLVLPCCVCIYRHNTDKDEPCISCGHNSNHR